MSLKGESKMEFSLRPGLIRQHCSWGSGWCGRRSVKVQFDINLATFVTAGRE